MFAECDTGCGACSDANTCTECLAGYHTIAAGTCTRKIQYALFI